MRPLGNNHLHSRIPMQMAPRQLFGADLLEQHGQIRHPKSLANTGVATQQSDSGIDPSAAGAAGVQVASRHRNKVGIQAFNLNA